MRSTNPMEDAVGEYYARSRHREADQPTLFALAVRIAAQEQNGVELVMRGMPDDYLDAFEEHLQWLAEGIPRGEVFSHNLEPPSLDAVEHLLAEVRRRR